MERIFPGAARLDLRWVCGYQHGVRRWLPLLLVVAGCDAGAPAAPSQRAEPDVAACDRAPSERSPMQRVRRLADRELLTILEDLGVSIDGAAKGLVQDPRVDGWDIDARGLVITGSKL